MLDKTALDKLTVEVMNTAKSRFARVHEDIETFEKDVKLFEKDIRGSLNAGWSTSDILSFMGKTEEMNPNLSEDRALELMKVINDRNETNFGGHRKW